MATDLLESDLYTLVSEATPEVIKELAIRYLNISEADIAHLTAECRGNTKEIAFKTLLTWKNRNIATRKQLFDVCEKARIDGKLTLKFDAYSFLCPGALPRIISAAAGQMAQGSPPPTMSSVQYPALEDLDLNNLAIAIPSDHMATLVLALKISEGEQEDTLTKYGSPNRHYRLKILQIWSRKNNSDRKLLAQTIHKCKIMTVAQIIEFLEVKQEDL